MECMNSETSVFFCDHPEATRTLARRLATALKGGELILFTGGMGAGKTTFVAGLAEGLAVREPAQSPTYAIVNVYCGRLALAHFDLYRIDSVDDLEAAGFYDYLDQGAVLAVEWSENLPGLARLAGVEPVRIDIRQCGEGREIRVEGITFEHSGN